MRSKQRRDGGASLVEFALLAPLLFALLLGMFTGGIAMSRNNSMTNAVREGSRLGATLPEDGSWAEAVRQRVIQLAGGDLDGSQVCVELIKKTSASAEIIRQSTSCSLAASAEPSVADVPVGQCAVKVWASRTSDLEVVFFSRVLTLQADAIARYERAGSPATCAS